MTARVALSGVLLAALWLACDEPEAQQTAPAGTVRLRVVSLSPVASEFLLALGAGPLIVGVDLESSELAGLQDLPVVAASGAALLSPDLVLVPSLSGADEASESAPGRGGAAWIEFSPHNLEDVLALCRDVGGRVAGELRALRFETDLSRPLARIGGESFGQTRPRVLAVVGVDPIELAGGHSFETDLIEIAGATSVTHGGGEPRLSVAPHEWSSLAPDLVLVVTQQPLAADERRSIRELLPKDLPTEFFWFDRSRFWLRQPSSTARRLRNLIQGASPDLG